VEQVVLENWCNNCSGCYSVTSFSRPGGYSSFYSSLSSYSWSWWGSRKYTNKPTCSWYSRIKFNFFNNNISRRRRWRWRNPAGQLVEHILEDQEAEEQIPPLEEQEIHHQLVLLKVTMVEMVF
jgi:hypothetical protein